MIKVESPFVLKMNKKQSKNFIKSILHKIFTNNKMIITLFQHKSKPTLIIFENTFELFQVS